MKMKTPRIALSGRFTVFCASNNRLHSHEIGYCRDAKTGNFIVTYRGGSKRQQIVVLAAAFQRITGIDRRSVANIINVTAAQLDELGFIRNSGKEAAAHVNVLPIAR